MDDSGLRETDLFLDSWPRITSRKLDYEYSFTAGKDKYLLEGLEPITSFPYACQFT